MLMQLLIMGLSFTFSCYKYVKRGPSFIPLRSVVLSITNVNLAVEIGADALTFNPKMWRQ